MRLLLEGGFYGTLVPVVVRQFNMRSESMIYGFTRIDLLVQVCVLSMAL